MKQYIIFLLSLFTTISFAQNKTIHLAHGLGGDQDSWDAFDDFIREECPNINTTQSLMASNQGIDVYSGTFNVQLEHNNATSNDIAIGHSFGGINLRHMDNLGTDYFGGYITVGSAHHGALLANSNLNGNFEDWVISGCEEVITDPLISLAEIRFIIQPDPDLVGMLENTICSNLYNSLLEKASRFLGNGESVGELVIDGRIANLPASSLPSIGITCSVNGNPLYRLLEDANFLNTDFNNIMGTGVNLTTAANYTAIGYGATADILQVLSNLTFNFGFKNGLRAKLRKASKEFQDGYNWLITTGPAWNQLIGAGGDVTWTQQSQQAWNCDCIDAQGNPVSCNSLDAVELEPLAMDGTCNTNDECWETTYISVPNFGPDKPSDGLVPVDNQSLPGSIHEETLAGVSHFAQPSDSGVHFAILKQLKTDAPIPFFIINQCL